MLTILLSSILLFSSCAAGPKKSLTYKDAHREFSKKICQPGLEYKYKKLLADYRKGSVYIPIVKGEVDLKAIKKNLPLIQRKVSWIEKNIKRLKANKKIFNVNHLIKKINNRVKSLLAYKMKATPAPKTMSLLAKDIKALTDKIFYLQSFNFPNDHLANRVAYDQYLGRSDRLGIHQKNTVYTKRKIIEDGTFDQNKSSPDIYLRSTLDTLLLSFKLNTHQLSENQRFDIDWVGSRIRQYNRQGFRAILARQQNWLERTKASYLSYKKILSSSPKNLGELVREKKKRQEQLSSFVDKRLEEVYRFWLNKPSTLRKIFVLETILFNEVGSVDGVGSPERKDVLKVVKNRINNTRYNQLLDSSYLGRSIAKADRDTYLDTMFKKGEFSFTYYYIPSVVKIFCPDMSRAGSMLRAENVRLSEELLEAKSEDFTADRYFSRISMFGKVNMAQVWSDHTALPQAAGALSTNQKVLLRKLRAAQAQYLYDFKDRAGVKFYVFKISGKKYSVRNYPQRPVFYRYRSPHLFTYFTRK